MSITLNTKAYAFDTNVTPDVGRHTGPAQTFAAKDYLDLSRTAPKPTATSAGVARSGAKLTRTLTNATTGETADAIFKFECSAPAWATTAQLDSLRDDLGDLLIATNGADLVNKHDINQ